jgi:UDP-galactopyranose mutase
MAKESPILVVGAGLSGAVIAIELARRGHKVTVIDQRDHIAGNAYDRINEYGIRVHQYGPHLFHTSNTKVVEWLSQFTDWLPYKHKVKALLANGHYVTLPVNRETVEIVGHDRIIDTFFRPYTKKMWGIDLEKLDPSILQRIPVRDDLNEFYFPNDSFQAMPKEGYTAMFEKILDHPNICVELNKKFNRLMEGEYSHVFNSMPIDEYFEFQHGELPYRSVKFHHHTLPMPSALPAATVNFTHSGPFTRVTEWKKIPGHGIHESYTTLTFEEPCDYKDNLLERYYPVKDLDGLNLEKYKKYRTMCPSHVCFIGRCGLYAYLDMHQAVSSALSITQDFLVDINSNASLKAGPV